MTPHRISDADLALRLSGALSREAMLPLLDLRDERALSAQLAEALRKFVAFRYLAGEPMYVNADDDTAARAALSAYESRNKEDA